MKNILAIALIGISLLLTNDVAACAHVDMTDRYLNAVEDHFVEDLRNRNFVYMGDKIGFYVTAARKSFVYIPETNELYRWYDKEDNAGSGMVKTDKDYDLRWIPHLKKCYEQAKGLR